MDVGCLCGAGGVGLHCWEFVDLKLGLEREFIEFEFEFEFGEQLGVFVEWVEFERVEFRRYRVVGVQRLRLDGHHGRVGWRA